MKLALESLKTTLLFKPVKGFEASEYELLFTAYPVAFEGAILVEPEGLATTIRLLPFPFVQLKCIRLVSMFEN